MAQGIANFTLPFIGGMPATGTIARTVTNIRAGAKSPIAGIVHATTLAVIVLAAAPLAAYIPLSVLAGILIFVAFNMGEWHAFRTLRQYSGHYRLMLLSTFLITVIFDLTLAIEFGLVLAFVLFIKRQSALFTVHITPTADGRTAVVLYGSLFFGVIGKLDPLQRLPQTLAHGSEIHVDASRLISLDTTGLDALKTWLQDLQKASIGVHVHGLQPQPASLMQRTGFLPLLKSYDAEEATQGTRATSDYNGGSRLKLGVTNELIDMNLFARPHYVSDTTEFIEKLKSSRPELEAAQRDGRALLWDKQVDAEALEQAQAARVAQQPYVYQTKPTLG